LNLPIRTRLTAIYCVAFCLSAAALEAGAYAALTLAVYAVTDRDLYSRQGGVEEFLNEHIARLPLEKLQHEIRTHTALQPDLLWIADADGRIVYSTPALSNYTEQPGTTPKIWTGASQNMNAPGASPNQGARPNPTLRVLSARRTIHGQQYELRLAADLTLPLVVVHRFGWLLLLSCPVLVAASAAVGHWTAARALSPVLAIATAARAIDAPDLSRRIAIPPNRDELRYLAETLNGMLARIEHAFRKTTEFTANASHELRTPLAVIRATAEVALMRAPGTDSDRTALQQILREAERNTALLEDLLRLARADSGTATLHMAPVDFAGIARFTCARCEPLAAARGVNLRLTAAPGPQKVSADAEHLKRLLLILLDNAIKYTPPGGFVHVTCTTAPSGHATCEVRDTGVGIAQADLPRIFERFFRSDRARTREESGAGLGLAIAEWIARVHQSRIEVESALGVGSAFRVSLPLLQQDPDALLAVSDPRLMPLGKRT
jgi:heavy metal sensor kinase